MKAGCVERAIVSAGGPKISCQGGEIGPMKRDVDVDVDFDIKAEEGEDDEDDWTRLDARGTGKTLDTPAFPSWTDKQRQEFQGFYEAINMQPETADKTYVPVTWGATSTSPMITSALHDKYIILSSLEPENILLDSSGHVSLCKPGLFGLELGDGDHILPGTSKYAAPETLLDDREASRAMDCWALGIILYEMLTGKPPFYHKDDGERRHKIINQGLQLPESLPLAARDMLTKLFDKTPIERLGANGAAEVKAHPFFHGRDNMSKKQRHFGPNLETESLTVSAEKQFSSSSSIFAQKSSLNLNV
ncbi:protein kinase domain protein [Aspergillus clavatus NRRL 1]|uniref:Protein kinase domain protein n=1 Tax=Aspergillus clavatus (strain ATCC 1007 / CBS 513.65 / DSM 816 / NCTC 3887 / NRRL 1 / QM 1276 / 107) TaxID=344612 RepID=A1CIE3_ASPCL|nr:protein kinase domain protein [Aspergillus clavatus NRRL 1]EAW10648.1 protein kinase domain protein [Aspergillus clavatus NRRL 1]